MRVLLFNLMKMEKAEDYGELRETFHCYRACAYIIVKVHKECPEIYKSKFFSEGPPQPGQNLNL